ncbi:MAG: glycosyltransferase family 4 protein [Bacteriovoracaceae bacterium]|nr:glycosyltransferase family 4 protein [Bacteriovoracaceae bacterium]
MLRIAQVAPLYESVPPQLYGGTERVVSNLTDALVELGHEVTLFASGDSITSARLVSPCTSGLRLDRKIKDPLPAHVLEIDKVARMQEQFDIIHFHCDYLHLPIVDKLTTPSVTTVHSRLDLPELRSLYQNFNHTNLISISHSQRSPLTGNNWVGNVYHGLNIASFKPSFEKGKYFTFLGRLSPEKGPDKAIRLAIASQTPLKIAAKIDSADKHFYEKQLRPLMEHPLIEFIGEVGEIEKQRLLANSLALLFPINWPEPFGIVMIEAMACGTPVLAFNNGSVPEVVDEGVTGLVANNELEALDKIKYLDIIDRKLVRKRFEERFDRRIMAYSYEHIYKNVIEGRTNIDSEIAGFF